MMSWNKGQCYWFLLKLEQIPKFRWFFSQTMEKSNNCGKMLRAACLWRELLLAASSVAHLSASLFAVPVFVTRGRAGSIPSVWHSIVSVARGRRPAAVHNQLVAPERERGVSTGGRAAGPGHGRPQQLFQHLLPLHTTAVQQSSYNGRIHKPTKAAHWLVHFLSFRQQGRSGWAAIKKMDTLLQSIIPYGSFLISNLTTIQLEFQRLCVQGECDLDMQMIQLKVWKVQIQMTLLWKVSSTHPIK